jgi:hypothetical protein
LIFRIPLSKLITVFLRFFSRPVVTYAKNKHLKSKTSPFAGVFIFFGRFIQQLEYKANKILLNKPDLAPPKEFSAEVSIEKGVESFYEIIFYTLAIGLPIY